MTVCRLKISFTLMIRSGKYQISKYSFPVTEFCSTEKSTTNPPRRRPRRSESQRRDWLPGSTPSRSWRRTRTETRRVTAERSTRSGLSLLQTLTPSSWSTGWTRTSTCSPTSPGSPTSTLLSEDTTSLSPTPTTPLLTDFPRT